ncbi:hypothetical protein GCM10011581_18550 [Saccharopolyspora subtropica]|uniref:DUF320 domain-containing protein n=1 Tax=Saccharopolyspora thermophila TaxID=89367 RepID=A0A917NBP8_9PSEU|nr:hypothetical protein [Saccharopolyspora subtropica]GGI81445.1 hypothetical protein GCM10011581_18550 [Saccharopolyspora subtropica]
MRKSVGLAGVVAASAGVLAGAAPAFADSADNDGINIGNDNNLSVLPVQLCGNNVAVLGAVVSLLSPQLNHCGNAPIVDHPSTPKPPTHDPKPPTPPTCEEWAPIQWPGSQWSDKWGQWHDKWGQWPDHCTQPPGVGQPPMHDRDTGSSVTDPSVPTAPTPVAVRGHHAVTG